MTRKEENIVNIAMKAANLLDSGKIKMDEMAGFAGLTETIISMAEQFEKEYGHVDYNAAVEENAPIRDYWEDIDSFAEEKLMDLYAPENAVVQERLSEKETAIVSMVSAGGVQHELFRGSCEECEEFCDRNQWELYDENRFCWDLSYVSEYDGDSEPTVLLSDGWRWRDFTDGSGCLLSPDCKHYFRYDIPQDASFKIRYEAFPGSPVNTYFGKLDDFKYEAEKVAEKHFALGKSDLSSQIKQAEERSGQAMQSAEKSPFEQFRG